MVSKSQKARLGVFITISVLVLLTTIIVMSFSRFFQDKDVYYIAYEDVSVSGLDIGSPVKYLGIKVGNVSEINIDPEDLNTVIVTVKINEATPIKRDVKAEIATIGITGLKLIELRGGSNEAETLPPGSFIAAGRSFTEDITGKAEVIAEKVEQVLNNMLSLTGEENRQAITEVVEETKLSLQETRSSIEKLNSLLTRNNSAINRTIANIDTASSIAVDMGRTANETIASIKEIIESDTVSGAIYRISSITRTLEEANIYDLITRLNNALVTANNILGKTDELVSANRPVIAESINDMNQTIESLKRTVRSIENNPAVLIGGSEPANPPDEKLEK